MQRGGTNYRLPIGKNRRADRFSENQRRDAGLLWHIFFEHKLEMGDSAVGSVHAQPSAQFDGIIFYNQICTGET